jgi:hypothetical protein
MEFIMEKIVLPFIIFFLLIGVVTLIVYGLAQAINSKKCLELGYPESTTTWNFDGYCKNIEGAVSGITVKLDS